MELKDVFSSLKEIECRCMEFYSDISKTIGDDAPDVHKLFSDLSQEEKIHMNQIAMIENYHSESPDSFIQKPEMEREIHKVLQLISEKEEYFHQNFRTIKTEEICAMVIDLESLLEQKHYSFYVKLEDANLKKLLKSLVMADQAHAKLLSEFFNRHN